MYDENGDARKRATPAISSTVPRRPKGIRLRVPARREGSSVVTFVNLVSTNPGAIPLTRMPSLAHACAKLRVRPSTPAFEALYAGFPLVAKYAAIELMMIIVPWLCTRKPRNFIA